MRAIFTKSDQHRGIRPHGGLLQVRQRPPLRRTQFLHKSVWIAGGVLRVGKQCWTHAARLTLLT